jgi:hypothetical protein
MEILNAESLAEDNDAFLGHFQGQLSFEDQGADKTAMFRGLYNKHDKRVIHISKYTESNYNAMFNKII